MTGIAPEENKEDSSQEDPLSELKLLPHEELEASLGRCHATLATGAGSSVAALGMLVEAGEWASGAAGVVVASAAVDLLAKESFGNSNMTSDAQEYPRGYGHGLFSVLPWAITAGGLACADIVGAGPWIMGGFAAFGSAAYVRQRIVQVRYEGIINSEDSNSEDAES